MRGVVLCLVLLALAACNAPEASRLASDELALPPMRTFARMAPQPPRASNAQLARDFLDLTFELENGEALPVFSRIEGPITLRVLGRAPNVMQRDLDQLLARLRREARIDIREVPPEDEAAITVELVSRSQIRGISASAACFVRPNVSSWKDYRARRRDPGTRWTRLTERRAMAVFLPGDASPQEMRDCLHEEIAQALGPVNDLYRLRNSVFNDDNFHGVLTGFDMLMLRVSYDPALKTGMNRPQVAQRLPGILARLNPGGGTGGIAPPSVRLGDWEDVIRVATAPGGSSARKMRAAARAVELAKPAGARDPRLAFSYYVLGRQSLLRRPSAALDAFLQAERLYAVQRNTGLQRASVDLQIAVFQLASGQARHVERAVDAHLGALLRSQDASRLSLTLLIKAEALEIQGRLPEATRTRREGLAWGRYGFDGAAEVEERAAEIRAISPLHRAKGKQPS